MKAGSAIVAGAPSSALSCSSTMPIEQPAASTLSVSGLSKTFGSTVAVDNISFEVRRNEIVGLLGPNGAGKTTTINMVLGILEPAAGTIRIEGIDLGRHRSRALESTNFAAVYAPVPGNLTVYQNLRIFGMIYGVDDLGHRIEELLRQFDLVKFRNVKSGVLSSGEQTRVSLAKAMLNRPRLLLLDEPTASLDPSVAREIRNQIREFAGRNEGGVLWTSHNLHEVEEVCGRVLFLSHMSSNPCARSWRAVPRPCLPCSPAGAWHCCIFCWPAGFFRPLTAKRSALD